MELSERKKQILRAVVENYIQTAEPVGSKAIVVSAGLKVSSATIRNEMAELETLGYLEQPHTCLLYTSGQQYAPADPGAGHLPPGQAAAGPGDRVWL